MARKGFGGFDLTNPVNRIVGKVALAINVRAYLSAGFTLRSLLSDAILTVSHSIQTIARLNDSTPAGPMGGFTYVVKDSGGDLYDGVSGTLAPIATGMSVNPVSLVPFRPNASVQPWMYVGDDAPDGNVSITTKFAIDNSPSTFLTSGMLKVRSDGRIYKMGIKEPQSAPIVSTAGSTTPFGGTLSANTTPWTNTSGLNGTYNYSQTTAPGSGGIVNSFLIPLGAGAQSVTLAVTGTANINGATGVAPSAAGPTDATHPGSFVTGLPSVVVAAFINGTSGGFGTVITGSSPVPIIANVGAGTTLQVPAGATGLQVGINSSNTQLQSGGNSGSFVLSGVVTTSAVATVVSTLGNVTAYVFGDSPHSGPVATYIWKNPNDAGTGTPRTTSQAAATTTNNSWIFDSSPEDGTVPVQWSTLASDGTVTGSVPLFTPALESEGYQDFNCCVVGSLFFPAAGSYTLNFQFKDQILVGLGAEATVTSVSGATTTTTHNGQTETVVSALPLALIGHIDGTGTHQAASVTFTVAGPGALQVEIDWDYWEHTGRSLIMQCNSAVIPPLPSGTRTNVSYIGVYRSSLTGALSNPSPASTPQVTPVLDNTITIAYSPDPQVDKVDYYRQDSGLPNYTYVATGPNTNPPTAIVDALSDTAAAANPILQFDNFEPFPSIDLPASGLVNVSGGNITLLSGTPFNVRWLPGTIIEIGSPTQLAYTLYTRPTTASAMFIPGVPDGTNLVYNIAEPILAAQPLPYLFGPTDNINFMFGVGDPLRPGTLYWCKGSNLDSAPDTNQMDVTDPSEPLVNGCMSGGRGVLASIKRFWVIMPNFFNAEATATGTSGSTWTLQATSITRGLFIPRCLAVSGGGNIFFRVDDGIHVSPGGLGSESITDGDLYPLFAHEGSVPGVIIRDNVHIYPPDDSQPEKQQFNYNLGYLYYDYFGTDGNFHTLVFDEAAGGWIYDLYNPTALTHASNEDESVQGLLVGCSDKTLRSMTPFGTETPVFGQVLTPAIGGQGFMYIQEVTVEYSSNSTINLATIAADTNNGSYGANPVTLPATGGQIAKTKFLLSANKFKLVWFNFLSADPTFKIYIDGFAVRCKNWGAKTPFRQMNPMTDINPYFPQRGGFGSENDQ